MKIRLAVICLAVIFLSACGASTSYSSRKKVTQGIDYSHYGKNEAYYEFSSAIPGDEPNAFTAHLAAQEAQAEKTETEEELGEDEDFVSEGLANSYHTYGDVVVTVASRKFELGSTATRKEMSRLEAAIKKAYSKALRTYQPSGFTYTMSSAGSVNPLSAVQVQCRMSERSANNNGEKVCKLFFEQTKLAYAQLSEEVQK
ncbi:MAG: hypothetical protein J6V32_00190 [Elusimicrobiaceae bacterium]|nr:hypothetical protein [Elusimicrobiaceae bacterium]